MRRIIKHLPGWSIKIVEDKNEPSVFGDFLGINIIYNNINNIVIPENKDK